MFFYLRKNSLKNVNFGLVGTSSLVSILIFYLIMLVRDTCRTRKSYLLNFENKNGQQLLLIKNISIKRHIVVEKLCKRKTKKQSFSM